MIDRKGFRSNVGIILANDAGQVLWARRVGGANAWQFPQGGIDAQESAESAMYRELHEEIGLEPDQVRILARTRGWLRYRLPPEVLGSRPEFAFVGQKQRWFLLRLLVGDEQVRLDLDGAPEFDCWRWVSYWYPLGQVVRFKQGVYRRALVELVSHLPANGD